MHSRRYQTEDRLRFRYRRMDFLVMRRQVIQYFRLHTNPNISGGLLMNYFY